MASYGYGIDAIRSHGRGASSVGVLIQLDLSGAPSRTFNAPQPQHWRGWQWFFGS
jgi:hypothetical protein